MMESCTFRRADSKFYRHKKKTVNSSILSLSAARIPWKNSAVLQKKKVIHRRRFIDQTEEGDELIYMSCLPWLDLTGCTHERNLDIDDMIPRITWGKIMAQNGRETLGMSVEVNHRIIDGVHIGRFYEGLPKMIDEL